MNERERAVQDPWRKFLASSLRNFLPPEFPLIVTLCGSTRFAEDYKLEQARLTNEGVIVLSVGRYGHQDGLDMSGEQKKRLDELHLRKIDLSDEIFVINCVQPWCPACRMYCMPPWEGRTRCCDVLTQERPYIGDSTRREIAYAESLGKRVKYLVKPTEVNPGALPESLPV